MARRKRCTILAEHIGPKASGGTSAERRSSSGGFLAKKVGTGGGCIVIRPKGTKGVSWSSCKRGLAGNMKKNESGKGYTRIGGGKRVIERVIKTDHQSRRSQDWETAELEMRHQIYLRAEVEVEQRCCWQEQVFGQMG